MTFSYFKSYFFTETPTLFLQRIYLKIKFESDGNCEKDVKQIVECFAENFAEKWIGKSVAEILSRKKVKRKYFKIEILGKLKPLYNTSFRLLLGLGLRFCLRGKYSDNFNYIFLRNSYICFGQCSQQQQSESWGTLTATYFFPRAEKK